jgi:hypothetical protein
MPITELLTIKEKWKNATRKGKIALVLSAMIIIVLLILEVISRADPVAKFVDKYKNSTMDVINMPVMTVEFAALLIISIIITMVIFAAIVVLIIGYMEKRVYDTKVDTQQKINASKDATYNLYKALDKLSKFPYSDGTPTSREASLSMGISMIRRGFPSAAQL